jgi:transposase
VEVSEAWSTKLCSCCGALNDPGNSATYTCSQCDVKMNRDENGARSNHCFNIEYIGNPALNAIVLL